MTNKIDKIFKFLGYYRMDARYINLLPTIKNALSINIKDIKLDIDTGLHDKFEIKDLSILPESEDLFTLNGFKLPCWLDSDVNLVDDWLTTKSYYPIYYNVLKKFCVHKTSFRVLEIGVRTGYFGVVCAKAIKEALLYVGVDPNLYISYGLELASRSLKELKENRGSFDYMLINGYSNDPSIQNSLSYSGLFDVIHIDGNHTVKGKLIDLYLASKIIYDDGIILVDDFDYHSIIVQDAIKRAMALKWFRRFSYIATKRGLAILQI